MPTLEENVNRVKAAKTAIGAAITAKGGTVGSNDGLEDFASDIASIPSGGGVEFSSTPTRFTFAANAINLNVQIPNGCTELGPAFNGFKGLKSAIIPNTVTLLDNNCFSQCSALTDVQMSNAITAINANAFLYCTSLKSIEIPATVREIGTNAFGNCTSLEYIKFYGTTTIPSCQTNTFTSLPTTCKIYIPTGYKPTYVLKTKLSDSVYTYIEY